MKKSKLKYFSYHILVSAFALLLLYPVFWLVMSSFKVSSQIFITAESFIPKPFILSNYAQGWEGFGGHSFGVFIKNSLVFVVFVLIGDRKSTRLNSSHVAISYAVFCL